MQEQAWRMLYGHWHNDLQGMVATQLGVERSSIQATVDMSANMFRFVNDGLAVLYDRTPLVSNDLYDASAFIKDLGDSGLWSLMPRVQRDTLGIREMLVRVGLVNGKLNYRPVFPHNVEVWTDGEELLVPKRITETRTLVSHTGKEDDVLECFDLSEPDYPSYYILSADGKRDVTSQYLVSALEDSPDFVPYVGDYYPYHYQDGSPFIPYVVYHAQFTGNLWDPGSSKELVEGTLTLGVGRSFMEHGIRTGVWPQRWVIGAQPVGGTVTTWEETSNGLTTTHTSPQKVMTADPSIVLQWEGRPAQDAGQPTNPQIGQWAPAFDPEKVRPWLEAKAAWLIQQGGLNAADLTRASGDPGSGYALRLTNEAQRRVQRKYEPQMRVGDLELINKSAALLELPSEGFIITYQSLPLSPDEAESVRQDIEFRLTRKLISNRDALKALRPELTDKEIDVVYAELFPDVEDGAETKPEPLNGAQLQAVSMVIKDVAGGLIPRDAGIAYLALAIQGSIEQATNLMGSAGTPAFKPTTDILPAPTAQPVEQEQLAA